VTEENIKTKGVTIMSRRKLLGAIGSRLRKIRFTLGYSQDKMAALFGIHRTGYTKNENGETLLSLHAQTVLSDNYNISLDWLLCNKGPMYYKEKVPGQEFGMEVVREDVQELLQHMERLPLLRYEVLSFFQRFKVENKELIG
jgi:transcriptional regulator with XRE-family HTH domain